MHPADIKAALEKSGTRQSEIARTLCVRPQTVSLILHGHATSNRIARYIARIVGRSPAEIWPGRYFERRKAASARPVERREAA